MMVNRWTGVEVRALRDQALRRTQEEFADKTGFSVRAIGNWERAGHAVTLRGRYAEAMDTLYRGLDDVQRERFWAALPERRILQAGLTIRTLSVDALDGFWVTSFMFDGARHHADISRITPRTERLVTIKNFPPEPRTEHHTSGFRNEIEAELYQRHLIGRWKNVSDTYYFGSVHLAVLPGETVLDGYYTGFANDIEVVAQRWKWVRLDPETLSDVELSELTLKEPAVIYALIHNHSYTSAPLALRDVTEVVP